MKSARRLSLLLAVLVAVVAAPARADETCNSPYMGNLIKGQEDYVYVWTLGVKGLGDGFDKLVTIDANPSSKQYGKVTRSPWVGAARRITWASPTTAAFSGRGGSTTARSSSST
jgi:selenium-binding protein 1